MPATDLQLRSAVTHDVENPEHKLLIDTCIEHAKTIAQREGRAPTQQDVREVFKAVTVTGKGTSMSSLVGVGRTASSKAWLEASTRVALEEFDPLATAIDPPSLELPALEDFPETES